MFKRTEGSKQYDLEERTLQFAKDIRVFVKALPRTIANEQDIRQLVRASGSVGANYIQANESLSKKDGENDSADKTRDALIQEATELMNIFGAIVRKSE
jgi:hypothetical protein